MNSLELKVPPVLLSIITAAMMWFTSILFPAVAFDIQWQDILTPIFLISGSACSLLGVIEFRKNNTTVDPRIPHQSNTLVITGIYKFCRNPMYLGFLFMLIAWAMFLSNLLAFTFLPMFIVYMNKFQIAPEERWMSEKFGEDFRLYMLKVRRWI